MAKPRQWRKGESAWQGGIIAFMAGAEAEIEFFGHCVVGDGDDKYQIALMAEELPAGVDWNTPEPRLRAMTRMLIRRHRTRIERVAKASVATKTLCARDLDRLVGRSVDDVKQIRRSCWLQRGKTLKLGRIKLKQAILKPAGSCCRMRPCRARCVPSANESGFRCGLSLPVSGGLRVSPALFRGVCSDGYNRALGYSCCL